MAQNVPWPCHEHSDLNPCLQDPLVALTLPAPSLQRKENPGSARGSCQGLSDALAQLREENHPKPSPFCSYLWLSLISHPAPLAETPGITNLQTNPGVVGFWSTTLATAAPNAWIFSPKKTKKPRSWMLLFVQCFPQTSLELLPACRKCPYWKKPHHEHPMGRRSTRTGSIFHCGGETLSLLPFHLFPPPKLQQNRKMCW